VAGVSLFGRMSGSSWIFAAASTCD
jgi:hypothetical protein